MSQSFQTGCSDISLTGTPWNTTEHRDLWVEYAKNEADEHVFTFFTDSQCQNQCAPPEVEPPNDTPTALNFHLVDPDDVGIYFDTPTPITWNGGSIPPTITYGKILESKMAFSMKDEFDLPGGTTVNLGFDLRVYVPGSGVVSVNDHIASVSSVGGEAPVETVDPTIVEKGDPIG